MRQSGTVSILGADALPSFTYILLYEDSFGDSVDDYKTALTELYNNGTPLEIVSQLKTDYFQRYQLSPATLSTLMFDNNFWSNADRIEIEYDYIGVFDAIESRKNIFSATPHLVTAKDSIISFGTDMAVDLKGCKVWFMPKQDLNGYDRPWIGGSGKNLFDKNNLEAGGINANGTDNTTARFFRSKDYIEVLENTYYTLSASSPITLCLAKYYDENKVYLGESSWLSNPASFQTLVGTKYIRFVLVYADLLSDISWVQLELGSTATAYEPYENVCPIEGWDGVTIYKNLGEDFYTYSVAGTTSSVSVTKINENSFRLYAKNKAYPASKQMTSALNLTLGKQYMISFDITVDTLVDGHDCRFGFRNTSNTFQADASVICSNSGHYNFVFTFDSLTRLNYLSLCETSGNIINFDATVYNLEIYEVEEITIPFPQTIYGGYVDLVKGEIVETDYLYDIDNLNWSFQDAVHSWWINLIDFPNETTPKTVSSDILPATDVKGICSNYVVRSYSRSRAFDDAGVIYTNYSIGIRSSVSRLYCRTDGTNDVMPTGFVVLPLAAPITYPIDPQTLKTLRGANTIWSNSNSDVEITYWKHNDDAYQHVPSSPITSNDNFIIVTDDGYAIGEEDDFIVY